MSARIYQQVNLYQPIFRRQKQVFSAMTMLQSLAVVIVALLTIYAYGRLNVGRLESEAVLLEGREKANAAQLAGIDSGSSQSRRASVEQELEKLKAKLATEQRLIEVLEDRPPGSTAGFSADLAALGRSHKPGLWLTDIRINGSTNSIELAGRSVDPARVPVYLLRLGEEEALRGLSFDRFEIERDEDAGNVEFRVSSEAVTQ